MHPFVETGANLEQALRGAAAIIKQNDQIGPLGNIDSSSLTRVRIAAHRFDDFDRRLGRLYSLQDLGENLRIARHLTDQRDRPELADRHSVDVVRPLDDVTTPIVPARDSLRFPTMMIVSCARLTIAMSKPSRTSRSTTRSSLAINGQIRSSSRSTPRSARTCLLSLSSSVKSEHEAVALLQC